MKKDTTESIDGPFGSTLSLENRHNRLRKPKQRRDGYGRDGSGRPSRRTEREKEGERERERERESTEKGGGERERDRDRAKFLCVSPATHDEDHN